jgi:hypothetical protein
LDAIINAGTALERGWFVLTGWGGRDRANEIAWSWETLIY